ncbi:uncharacterized protein LOC128668828 [Microplitis demolitor]|uniref:uncharacterized protein LOC128668828 n=1 Tax=Microplitis demolitor TaxID=69319 RepID=UPI00235B6255|nr:uncharacterized protein LOC128668828 [Microplitis demolitor]
MLVFCQVGNPIKLWDKYRDNFTDDIKRRMSRNRENSELDVDIVYNQCLINLEDMVIAMSGKTLLQFGLTSPSREQESGIINQQYLNELAYDTDKLTEEVIKSVPILNKEQTEAYESILNSVVSDSGRLSEKSIAIAVASSGIAATLIDGGKKSHSTFKLPLEMNHSDNILCNISKQSYMAHVIREAKLIVWDECTMAHKNVIEALNRTLKDIRNSDRIMGGITVVLASDFRQTLPVVPRGTRADEVKACLKSSVLWPHVNVLSLKINMRVHIQHDLRAEEFSKLLIDIGNGQISEVDGRISIPDNLGDIVDDLTTLTDKIYPDINKIGVNCSSWLKERAILTPTNDSANSINNYLIEKLSTNQMKYKSIDTVVEVDDAVHYPVEFLHTLNPPGIPSHILNLKIGAPIMLLRNLNPPKLCNGKHEGEVVFIPRIPLVPSDYHFNFKRLQFPVRVCYAMTINKAQGQSLKLAGVDLRHDCFSHGQFYVACSRVSSPDNLIILQPEKKTKNIVYKEVLSL